MLFNFGKCKCLHTGHGNLNVNYKMGATVLGTTVKEKDLGVTISANGFLVHLPSGPLAWMANLVKSC